MSIRWFLLCKLEEEGVAEDRNLFSGVNVRAHVFTILISNSNISKISNSIVRLTLMSIVPSEQGYIEYLGFIFLLDYTPCFFKVMVLVFVSVLKIALSFHLNQTV